MRWVLAALLMLPTATGAPFLMDAGDPLRSGAVADPGPETFDLAFHVRLPSPRADHTPLVVLDRAVYALTRAYVSSATSDGTPGLWRIDLDDARVELLVDLTGKTELPGGLATDGERLFVAWTDRVHAYDPGTGEELWAMPYMFPDISGRDTPGRFTGCGPGVVTDRTLYIPCFQTDHRDRVIVDDMDMGPVFTPYAAFTVALDAVTGEERWVWIHDLADETGTDLGDLQAADHEITFSLRLVVTDDLVLPLVQVAESPRGEDILGLNLQGGGGPLDAVKNVGEKWSVWALDRDDGGVRWTWIPDQGSDTYNALTDDPDALAYWSNRIVDDAVQVRQEPIGLAVQADHLYVKGPTFEAIDLETGELAWDIDGPTRQPDERFYTGHGLGVFNGRIFFTQYQTMYAYDADTNSEAWSGRLPSGEDWEDAAGVLHANGIAYAMNFRGRLFAYDAETGAILHERLLGRAADIPLGRTLAIGDSVVAAADTDGNVWIIGRTAASIGLDIPDINTYPRLDEELLIDLSGTAPGVLNDTTEFRITWGDGTADGWTADAVFRHAYDRTARPAAGDLGAPSYKVVIEARNDAGQEASHELRVFAGQPAPVPPTFLERAFSAEHQELTFFIMGLVVTLVGAAIGLMRYKSRHSRLRQELAAVEHIYQTSKDRPRECEQALMERRAHARGLLDSRKLTDSQLMFVEKRIDERLATTRMGLLDRHFDFLTISMGKTLHEMLGDGRVSSAERDAFFEELAGDKSLTKAQVKKVRDLVDQWFQSDETARAYGAP